MKKLVKTIILLPMWPLIWFKLGLDLRRMHEPLRYSCGRCGGGADCSGCMRRAKAMVHWWRA